MRRSLVRVWWIAVGLFALQAAGLVVYSAHVWQRFDLTNDFANFHQAWQQIATGHLDPYDTTFAHNYPHWGYPFWRSHFELAMWPLALLWFVWPHSVDLLVVQDLALAGAGLVALRWGLELVDRHWAGGERSGARAGAGADAGARAGAWARAGAGAPLVGAGLVVVLLADPWTYWAASFDFHFQPLACLFLVLAGRDLWLGRRRAWWWVAGVLACGDVASTYLVGLGFSAIVAGRRTWRPGIALVALSVAWLGLVSVLGAGLGSSLSDNYGYLASGHAGPGLTGIVAILAGMVRHPATVAHVLGHRGTDIYKFLAGAGTIGAASTVGIGVAAVVLVANGLNQSPGFVGATAAFQDLAAVLVVAVGATALLAWLSHRGRPGLVLAGLLGVAGLAQALVVAVHWVPMVPGTFLRVDAATAAELAMVRHQIPAGAEVIASQGVMGRFAGRRWVYPFLDSFSDGQTVPVPAATVVFVFTPEAGIETATPSQTGAAVTMVRQRLHARVLARRAGVEALVWHRPATRGTITFGAR